jgi:transposase
MQDDEMVVIGGVDAHYDTHDAAALDERGALLGRGRFAASLAGYADLLGWLQQFGQVKLIGIESTGAYAAGLVRYLREHQIEVIEVNRPHRHTRRRRGKSDAIDAEAAARMALSGEAKAIPKQTGGIVESIRQLRVARDSAVKARSAALIQFDSVLVTAPQQLREDLAARGSTRARLKIARGFRPSALQQPLQAAKHALRSIARRVEQLDGEINDLDRQLAPLVATAAPRTIELLGIATGHAGQFLVTAGQNIDRIHSEAAFAALCGANPIPASSGKTTRHRLNYGGDRHANSALHMIAIARLGRCERTRAYAQRRLAEGKTKRDVIRCLKRYIAREVYTALRADLADLQLTPPAHTLSITCGALYTGRKRT